MSPLIPQVPNLNGSARNVIVGDYCDVMLQLKRAIEAMQKTRPHPRDYNGPDVVTARIAWEERIRALWAMHKELEDCALAVQMSKGGRP